MTPANPIVAEVVRSGYVESVHRGAVVVADRSRHVEMSVGDTTTPMFPRSSLKPLQALAMLRHGWAPADDEQVALACASHNGESRHLDVVRRILDSAGLDVTDLDNTPDLPLDPAAARAWLRAGGEPDALHQNCSGKHAAMLATCVANGWPTAGYRDPAHPLQLAIKATVEQLCGEPVAAVAVDGCGAPLFAVSLTALAAAFAALGAAAAGTPERRVADAMRAHPMLVGGTERDVTALMRGLPGLVAKDGAEGVYAAGLPDGRGVALKIDDGSGRARAPLMVAVLSRLGYDAAPLADLATTPVLGHGEQVGEVRATLPT